MYGTQAHEDWLIEQEREDDRWDAFAPVDHPWTPCGCVSRAYGGDCAHTVDMEFELEGSAS